MSGHSKWSTIKHKKALNDAKKGKIFSKLSVQITLAARQGGGDPEMNPSLRLLLDEAKREGFPADNIKKAIEKGTGQGGAGDLTEVSYEGFGPAGIQIMVDVLTDNINRSVSDLRKIFSDNGGNLAESGAVSWNFESKGLINMRVGKMVKSEKFGQDDDFVPSIKDDVMLEIMDIEGVDDIQEGEDDSLDVYTNFDSFGKVRDAILSLGYVVNKAQMARIAKINKKLEGEGLEKAINFLEVVEDLDDVQNVWTDLVN